MCGKPARLWEKVRTQFGHRVSFRFLEPETVIGLERCEVVFTGPGVNIYASIAALSEHWGTGAPGLEQRTQADILAFTSLENFRIR